MSLGTAIRNAIAPTARQLIGSRGVGATGRLRRAEITRAADNSEIRSYEDVLNGAALDCVLIDDVSEATQKEWGLEGKISAIGLCSDLAEARNNDGLIITAGHRLGTHFRVLKVRPQPLAGVQQLALQTTQETFS